MSIQRTAPSPHLLLTALLSACAPTALQVAPLTSQLPADRPLIAAFLIVEGVYNTELTAPYDILHHTPFHTKPGPGIQVYTVSPDGAPVKSFEGLTLVPHHSFATAPKPDILIVPSAEGSMDKDLENRALIDWVRKTGEQARFVMSLCDGAFVLAQAGLLDGKVSTTFPSDVDRYRKTFPQLDVRERVSFVHHGKALTSQGGAKSFDVAMYLVAHLYGAQVAKGVGRGLVIPWPPLKDAMPAIICEGSAVACRD